MKSKLLNILLIGIIVLGLTGCGDTQKESTSRSNKNNNQKQEQKGNKEQEESKVEEPTGDYVYMFNIYKRMKIGTEPASYGDYYSTAEEAMKAYGYDMTIRHTLENGKIKESYVGFKYNGKIYYIKGQDSKLYEQNKKELKKIFGESKCSETTDYFNCFDDSTTLGVIVRKDGSAEAGFDKEYCISYDDFAKCGTH